MFCPSCGAETSEGLSYCKRCGARLGAAGDGSRPRVTGLIWAVSLALALITLAALVVFLGFMIEFGRDASNVALMLCALLLLVVFAVNYLLARQLSRLIGFHLHGRDDGARPGRLGPAAPPAAQLEPPRPPAYGELEQTTRALGDHEQATRALDPVPREREPR